MFKVVSGMLLIPTDCVPTLFSWLGLSVSRATHAWQAQSEIPDGVTLEEDPTYLKKTKLESSQWEGPIPGQLYAKAFKRDTAYLAPGATERAGGVFSQ